MSSARVVLLGGFSVVSAGRTIAVPLVARRLLAFLALNRGPVLRPFMAGTLWPDSSDERAAASLRTTLWKLRRTSPSVVMTTADHIWLDPAVATDLAEATAFADRVLSGQDLEDWASEVTNLQRDLLPDWYDEWLVTEREQFRHLRLHALERLCMRLVVAGDFAAAVDIGLAAVGADPLRESSRRALIAAHLAEGNRHEALREYATFRRVLLDEVNAVPSAEMEALIGTLDTGGVRGG
jgi:DNA-binding SARP family transcriptional activator